MKLKFLKIFRNWNRRDLLLAILKDLLLILGIGYLFYGYWWCGLAGLIFLVPMLKRDQVRLENQRQARMNMEFREALQSMRTAMHTGYAAENAIAEAMKDLVMIYGEQSEMVKGFRYMDNELRMQIPLEQVWRNFAERCRVEVIRDFAVILQTAKRSGGDMVSIMDHTEAVISQKLEAEQEIATLLSAKILEWRIMTAVPLAIILYMRIAFSEFMDTMYGNPVGVLVMTLCLIVFGAAWMTGQRILRIEV